MSPRKLLYLHNLYLKLDWRLTWLSCFCSRGSNGKTKRPNQRWVSVFAAIKTIRNAAPDLRVSTEQHLCGTPRWTFRITFRKLRALIRPQGILFHLCYTLPFETITSWRWQTITWGVRWCPATLWPQSRVQCGTSSPSPKKLLSRWICPHQLSSPTSPCKSALFCLPTDGLFLD